MTQIIRSVGRPSKPNKLSSAEKQAAYRARVADQKAYDAEFKRTFEYEIDLMIKEFEDFYHSSVTEDAKQRNFYSANALVLLKLRMQAKGCR